jgi:hypothetical protein
MGFHTQSVLNIGFFLNSTGSVSSVSSSSAPKLSSFTFLDEEYPQNYKKKSLVSKDSDLLFCAPSTQLFLSPSLYLFTGALLRTLLCGRDSWDNVIKRIFFDMGA